MSEYVVLVDEEDRVLGTEEKLKAHECGLLHRAFSVFVYRKKRNTIEFLLQQRHPEKYHCGGLWTNTCCSHPRVEETALEGAKRRLKEEMSLDVPLRNVGTFIYKAVFENGLTEHELDHVFIGEWQENNLILVDENEVQDYRWMERDKLLDELKEFPERYTPWFGPALQIALNELKLS